MPDGINMGDTAFMILTTAMVLFMTPGLAFFYGGLARRRSVISLMMQSFISMGIVTMVWIFGGFGLAFGRDHGGVIGSITDFFALGNVGVEPHAMYGSTIPFIMFFAFQLMFCVITVPLMTGAFVGRMNMKGYIVFLIFWTLLIYVPVCHWIWGNGFLAKWGFVDFAGGTVIHTTAGFGVLASLLVLGKRIMKKGANTQPNNLMATAIGTGILWFGWFGFNSGGSLAANMVAATSFVNTLIGLSTAMVVWMIYAKLRRGKILFTDVLTGSVAGLATITPASGYIKPASAIIVGIVAGIICNLGVEFARKLDLDDALDVWGVHGVGGFTGTILIGFLADESVNKVTASPHQLWIQIAGVVLVAAYAFMITYLLLKILTKVMTVELSPEQQLEGLDKTLLQEQEFIKN